MTASGPTTPVGGAGGDQGPDAAGTDAAVTDAAVTDAAGTDAAGTDAAGTSSDQPLTVLRGNGVDIDPRRAARWVLAVCVMALFVVALILLVAGVQKNSQSNELANHGVRVEVRVTSCLGLLGGSGSNGAGYACKGTYDYQGRQYAQDIPGNARFAPGSTVAGVIAPDDPGLLSTPSEVAAQPASGSVFVAPAVLFVVFVLALVALIAMVRRGRRAPDPGDPS